MASYIYDLSIIYFALYLWVLSEAAKTDDVKIALGNLKFLIETSNAEYIFYLIIGIHEFQFTPQAFEKSVGVY